MGAGVDVVGCNDVVGGIAAGTDAGTDVGIDVRGDAGSIGAGSTGAGSIGAGSTGATEGATDTAELVLTSLSLIVAAAMLAFVVLTPFVSFELSPLI